MKSLILARIAVLRQTEAMLQQRMKASTFGISITYTIDGRRFVPPTDVKDLLRSVEEELANNQAKITRQEAETARYSGGLVHAMSLSTLATMKQTQAMLEQKWISLKYGIPQYVGFLDVNEKGPTTAARESRPTAANHSNQEPLSDVMQKAISLSVVQKGFIPSDPSARRYEDLITIKCSYSNGAEKDIRAFTGTLIFQDLFGKEIFRVSITISDPIAAHQQSSWTGTVKYNQFIDAHQRFHQTELRDMNVIWAPASILFSDGTKVGQE